MPARAGNQEHLHVSARATTEVPLRCLECRSVWDAAPLPPMLNLKHQRQRSCRSPTYEPPSAPDAVAPGGATGGDPTSSSWPMIRPSLRRVPSLQALPSLAPLHRFQPERVLQRLRNDVRTPGTTDTHNCFVKRYYSSPFTCNSLFMSLNITGSPSSLYNFCRFPHHDTRGCA